MALILEGVRWVSYLVLFVFFALCLATGLYYIAEMIEEYERTSKKARLHRTNVLRYLAFGILAIHLLLIIDGFPIFALLAGILTHLCYFALLARFPKVSLTNVVFILSGVMFIVDHVVWFRYFTSEYYPFPQILGFFVICVWILPFAIFIGLTNDDTDLPFTSVSARTLSLVLCSCSSFSLAGETSNDSFGRRKGKQNRFVAWIQSAQEFVKGKIGLGGNRDDYGYKSF